MLCNYDDCSSAVVVFNHYGDIVYRNQRAKGLTPGHHIRSITCQKIRLITSSLLNGLIISPFCFHADLGFEQPFLCHLHQHHNSYTLLLEKAELGDGLKSRASLFLH